MTNSISFLTAASVYNTLFWVTLAAGILLLILAVVMFFVWDIRNIYMIRSGKGERQTVKKMKEVNAATGRLRSEQRASLAESAARNTTPHSAVITPPPDAAAVSQTAGEEEDVSRTNETVMLGVTSATEDGEPMTTILGENFTGTDYTEYRRTTSGRFDVNFDLTLIHSDEII